MCKELFEEIIGRLENDLPPYLHYHSARHTQMVIQQAEFLAEKESVENPDIELIKIACLFHDTGFLIAMDQHEERSCKFASEELPGYGYSKGEIEKICGMIRATKVPQRPLTLNEKIVADADLFYLGTSRYKKLSEKLYQELQYLKPEITEEDWYNIQVNFLNAHHFHTNYAKNKLEPVKQENLQILKDEYRKSSD
ncbi:HD domain-containing protein [Gramella sp. BOM4]|nr:HD domain-containing protein [Christiangramia bathymodioli]